MKFKNAVVATTLALATVVTATTFHNSDTVYYVNVEHDDGSKTFVEPGGSVEVADGWAYIRACQSEGGGSYYVCPPGLLQWPSWYGDVYFYMGSLSDSSQNSIGDIGICQWAVDYFDPNDCPEGYQNLPEA